MADIKAIRGSCGGTVNDVVLTVIASTVRRYAKQHGVNLRGRQLRMIVPVNIRGDGDVAELGNRITFLPINVPLFINEGDTIKIDTRNGQYLERVGRA